jgi:hypothetical protein
MNSIYRFHNNFQTFFCYIHQTPMGDIILFTNSNILNYSSYYIWCFYESSNDNRTFVSTQLPMFTTRNHKFSKCSTWPKCPHWLKGMSIMTNVACARPKCYHVRNWFFLPKPSFLEFIWILSGKNHFKINISHILNPNLTK